MYIISAVKRHVQINVLESALKFLYLCIVELSKILQSGRFFRKIL